MTSNPPFVLNATGVFGNLYKAYKENKYNVFVLEGGSRSSKTYSIIQFLILWAYENQDKEYRVIIGRQKSTWISSTVWMDFQRVLEMSEITFDVNINKTVKIIHFFSTQFWFIGLDDEMKLRGLSSHIVWLNEVTECRVGDFDQLEQRCAGFSILDYNPSASEEFWVFQKVLKRPDAIYMHSTMLDNPYIPENSRRKILSYEPTPENYAAGTVDKRKWAVYGLGIRAQVEGVIFENYQIVKEIPAWARRRRRFAMDFGYTNDPTAIWDIWFDGGNSIWLDEVCYQTHMTNPDIGRLLIDKGLKEVKGYADSAEPKSIDEIHKMGINIHPVKKGAGSIINGIDILKRYQINITENSINGIREIKNYTYQQDKDERWLNIPVDTDNHLMDALRYFALMELGEQTGSPDRKQKTARALAGLR